MRWSRREFLSLGAALGLSSCARMGMDKLPLIDTVGLDLGGGKDAVFAFATIGDLHIKDAGSAAIVGRAIQRINADDRVKFVVIVGDLATDGALGELKLAKTTLQSCTKPYFSVPGNHDVDITRNDIYANYATAIGPTQWVEEQEGWALIGLDSCNGTASDVTIPQDRVEWLTKQVDRINNERPIALFVHHPLNPNTKAYRIKNADAILAVFAKHNLKVVASGHFHGNQIEQQNGILFATSACCSTTRDNHDGTTEKGYRLYHVDKGAVETEFVVVPV